MGIVKNSLVAIGLVVTFMGTTNQAKASLLVEPHLGYILGGNADYNGADVSFHGPDYGARIGAQMMGFMAGLDYSHSTFTAKAVASGQTVEVDKKRDLIGLFAGYNFPILLRAWGTYYLSSKTTTTKTVGSNNKGDYTKGTGMELGLGYTALPFLSLNLSYRTSTQDKNQSGTLSPELKTKEFVIGVSAPFTLL